MIKLSLLYFILFIAVIFVADIFAAQAPNHKSTRALSMGNAFVAVADDKEAVYYNPAGLWYMNKMGNYKTTPELGHYSDNWFDMRLNIGATTPLGQSKDIRELATGIQDIVNSSGSSQEELLDELSSEDQLMENIYRFDYQPIFIGSKLDMELAAGLDGLPFAIGASAWTDIGIAPYLDAGIITPAIGIDTVYADVVMQGAFAFDIKDKYLFGFGYKWSKREYLGAFNISFSNWSESLDSIEVEANQMLEDLNDFKTIGHSIDLGFAYIHSPELRLAIAMTDIYFTDLSDEDITPNLTFGMAFAPRKFQRNTKYARKVNFAADFADALDNENNYKFASHINFGVELEQVLFALSFGEYDLRLLKARVSGGFKGGYISAGASVEIFRLLALEFVTWGEETGSYTGQSEARYYLTQISLGF